MRYILGMKEINENKKTVSLILFKKKKTPAIIEEYWKERKRSNNEIIKEVKKK